MKLLIITQKVDANDHNLGFFVRWIETLAEHAELIVIANEVGRHALTSARVRVLSLGKERGSSRPARFFRYQKLLWRHLPRADGVFFHMCPEYVLGAHFLPRIFCKKTLLWYVHKKVSARLRLAAWFVDKIFTASPESCRLHSRKVEVVGHGIDVSSPPFDFRKSKGGDCGATNAAHTNGEDSTADREKRIAGLRLLTVGRIAPVKDIHTLILGFLKLQKRFPEATFSVVGEPITDTDRAYLRELRRISSEARFRGGVSHEELPRLLQEATVFVHASKTGSMDKAALEALAAGLPVFTSSEAFSDVIPGVHMFREGDPKDLAETIARAHERGELGYNEAGREWVKKHHSLDRLVEKIISFYPQT